MYGFLSPSPVIFLSPKGLLSVWAFCFVLSRFIAPASDPKTVEENLPPLQSHHLLMYGPAIMVEFGRCDGDCCCSIAQSCLTLCDPMDCSTLGLPVHHQLLELAQTHVH